MSLGQLQAVTHLLRTRPWLSPSQQLLCQWYRPFSAAAKGASEYRSSFLSEPHSLEYERGEVHYPQALEGNALGRALLTVLGAYSHKQTLSNGAAILYEAITEQAESKELAQAVGLDPAQFMTTFHLLSLHMWLVLHRIRGQDEAQAKPFRQALYSSYFYRDYERRVRQEVQVNPGKWVKQLEKLFYSSSLAYDMALAGQQPQLAPMQSGAAPAAAAGNPQLAFRSALLLNVYKEDPDKAPYAELLARYLERELRCLGQTPLEAIYSGQIKFSSDVVKDGNS